jgi:hypothetical protein
VLFRMKKVVNASDELYTQLSIGAGTPVVVGSTNMWVTFPDGYGVIFGRATQANSRLRKMASAAESTLGTAFTVAAFSSYADFELRYRSTGALSMTRNGTQVATATDTTHAAVDKGVAITQGNNAAGSGAKSTWDFVLARPYDGVDPSATVGSELTI